MAQARSIFLGPRFTYYREIQVFRTFKLDWFSVGLDLKTQSYFLSFPVSTGIMDYEEYYTISADWALHPEEHFVELNAFAEECRHQKKDDLLLQQSGKNRGTAV